MLKKQTKNAAPEIPNANRNTKKIHRLKKDESFYIFPLANHSAANGHPSVSVMRGITLKPLLATHTTFSFCLFDLQNTRPSNPPRINSPLDGRGRHGDGLAAVRVRLGQVLGRCAEEGWARGWGWHFLISLLQTFSRFEGLCMFGEFEVVVGWSSWCKDVRCSSGSGDD